MDTDDLIVGVANAFGIGADYEMIRAALQERLVSEGDIYLLIKAGENLYQARVRLAEEKEKGNKLSSIFRRSK